MALAYQDKPQGSYFGVCVCTCALHIILLPRHTRYLGKLGSMVLATQSHYSLGKVSQAGLYPYQRVTLCPNQ